jgi:carbamoyltransferase
LKILGLSCFYHDSAAALIVDGKIIAAAQEERFTRIKHDSQFPARALKYCLDEAKIDIDEIDQIVFYEKPFVKFERLIETYLSHAPYGFKSFVKAMPIWLNEKLFQKKLLIDNLGSLKLNKHDLSKKISFSEHHISHAASAFYPSPFDQAVILTMDGVGEWATTTICKGIGSHLTILKEIHFPHSLGLLYSAFTYFCGFKVNSGEYKLMGLAPYGVPRFKDLILTELLKVRDDGSFRLNLSYFDFATGLKMTNRKFESLFGINVRSPDQPLLQIHMDLAASIQEVTNEVVVKLASHAKAITGFDNICLAGGVALNCVANGVLDKKGIFKNIWVQPAAGDAGGSLGAALYYHFHINENARVVSSRDSMLGSYLGPRFESNKIQDVLDEMGANYQRLSIDQIVDKTVDALESGQAVGWYQGRMEYGPRALGNRSILADPRNLQMQKNLNLKIKFRESFRPFAPAVLEEEVHNWFDWHGQSPYMLFTTSISKRHIIGEESPEAFGIEKLNQIRSKVPAVTHVDHSARIQTVSRETNPLFYDLILNFFKRTGCPMLVNTSFNVRGEPIVCDPKDAYRCFMGTDLDVLVIGDFFLVKSEQPPDLKKTYQNSFELD